MVVFDFESNRKWLRGGGLFLVHLPHETHVVGDVWSTRETLLQQRLGLLLATELDYHSLSTAEASTSLCDYAVDNMR